MTYLTVYRIEKAKRDVSTAEVESCAVVLGVSVATLFRESKAAS